MSASAFYEIGCCLSPSCGKLCPYSVLFHTQHVISDIFIRDLVIVVEQDVQLAEPMLALSACLDSVAPSTVEELLPSLLLHEDLCTAKCKIASISIFSWNCMFSFEIFSFDFWSSSWD